LDDTKPDVTPRKLMHALGWRHTVKFEEELKELTIGFWRI